MRTKGTTVKAIQSFVKDQYPKKYNDWLESLPAKSKSIMEGTILATAWYPLNEGAIIPTHHLKMFYAENSLKAAWEAGRHSAGATLTGVYKIFVKVASPSYIIKRAAKITATYYENVVVESSEETSNSVVVSIIEFNELDRMIEQRIGGWMEKALELSGCKGVKIRIAKSLTRGDNITKYSIIYRYT